MTRTLSSTSAPAGFGPSSAQNIGHASDAQQVGQQSAAGSYAQAAHPALGGLRQRGAGSTGEARLSASAPRLHHLSADQIREAQDILRREGPAAYPRLEAEAQRSGCFPLSQYVNDRGESTDFGKMVKRQDKVDRVRDHAIRAGAIAAVAATGGLGVVFTPLGHAFRRAGERLNENPEPMFSHAPQSGQPANQPPEEEAPPPYPGHREPG